MVKKLTIGLAALAASAIFVAPAMAAPLNSNSSNIVANYSSGDHGIVGESSTHTGADVVMKAGNSGNFQQWFSGTSAENGGITEGDHSVWKNVGSATSCNGGGVLVTNAYPAWGSYLQPGANYCVKTNDSSN